MRILSAFILICTLAFLSSCDSSTETINNVKQGISGTVRSNESGQLISGANIWLTNIDSAEVLIDSAITSSNGTYLFDNLKVGRYRVYCLHDDFVDADQEVVVAANSNMVVNFDLLSGFGTLISFHVRNALTKIPINGATVRSTNINWSKPTDINGNLNYDQGSYSSHMNFDVSAEGYLTQKRTYNDVEQGKTVYDTIDLVAPNNFLAASYYFSNNFVDSSGNGNDGTGHGIAWTADRFGNPSSAIYCDGTTDYVSVADAPSLNFGKNDFTICVWVNTSGAQTSQGSPIVVDKSTIVSSAYSGYGIYYFLKTYASTYVGTTYGVLEAREFQTDPDSRWHLYTAVVDRSGYIHIYYDGKLEHTEPDTFDDLPGSTNTPSPLLIGGDGTVMNTFRGKIDDIKLFNVALDEEAIQAVFHENGW
jgi:hypothetical protein